MLELAAIDLVTDPAAARYIEHEEVDVVFAKDDGELISREGPNRFQAGDALITGSTADRWRVSRDRFDAKYEPVAPLEAGGDLLRGDAQDWLLQYAPDDHGIVENARFVRVYRPQLQ